MAVTSLIAVGNNAIEIGRYGTDLRAAKVMFLATCEDRNVQVTSIKESKKRIVIDLSPEGELSKLLIALAGVSGYPKIPCQYILQKESVPEDEYIQTGIYRD